MGSLEKTSNNSDILAVFANPRGSDALRLGEEQRVIKECLDLSKHRDGFNLDVLQAATIHDLRRSLLSKDYRIIHISGHGTGAGLVLEDVYGQPQHVPQEALADFLSAYSPPIECVILNACYTLRSGELLSFGVPFTIGVNGAISDLAAMEFTRGFYDAVGAGKDFAFAYQEGCRTVKLMDLYDGFEPVLFTETMPKKQEEIKIVSQHVVQLDDDEEEGFLDYILEGSERFETVTEITGRIAEQISSLGDEIEQDTLDITSLGSPQGKAGASEYKRVLDRSASRMKAFAQQLDEETPRFREHYSRAIDCYGRAANILVTDFQNDDSRQIREALDVVEGLRDSITRARNGLAGLRESIATLPRMTKNINKAKRHCLVALDNYDGELETGLKLTQDVADLMERLLEKGL